MRFVAVKSAEQQGRLMQHRVRDLLMRQRTQLINALRAHLAELGIAAAQGHEGVKELLAIVAQDGDSRLPVDAHASLIVLAAQLQAVQTMIGSIEKRVVGQHRSNEESKRLENRCDRNAVLQGDAAHRGAILSGGVTVAPGLIVAQKNFTEPTVSKARDRASISPPAHLYVEAFG